ncbi:hypothetical protein, partial [Escherichia coli]|uniref:hypothetical protein n=1 Tax=Escherichia coli TaxID=562 RepID=UPI001EDB0EF5
IPLRLVATDADGLSVEKSFVLTVANDPSDDAPAPAPNLAPTTQDGTAQTSEDTAVPIDVARLIADANAGDTLTVTATVPIEQGTVSVNGTVITFT